MFTSLLKTFAAFSDSYCAFLVAVLELRYVAGQIVEVEVIETIKLFNSN